MPRLIMLLSVCLLLSCKGSKNFTEFVGEYEILTRDGRPLPASLPTRINYQPCINDLLSATLTIRSNGTWTESLTSRVRCGPEGTDVRAPETHVESGTILPRDGAHTILLTSENFTKYGVKLEAVLTGDELHMAYSAESPASKAHDTNPPSVMRYTFRRKE